MKSHDSPLANVTTDATVNAAVQPRLLATYAVTIGDNHPPRFPNVFISPPSEPENRSLRSMQAAQNEAEANMLKPAAAASSSIAIILFLAWPPASRNAAEQNIPVHTATL